MTRIGVGSGFAGDRREPAVDLARHAGLDYLVFECLAERTIALRQTAKLAGLGPGYDEMVVDRIASVAFNPRLRIVTNGGGADPAGLGSRLRETLMDGPNTRQIAVATGDDVLHRLDPQTPLLEYPDRSVGDLGEGLVSANAYLGAEAIIGALQAGADIVVAGRVSDPSLFLAPLAFEHSWSQDDLQAIAGGTVVGHLLECAGQLTGGYFADGGHRRVPGLARLGFPFADVAADGAADFRKLPDSGGLLSVDTVLEQLFYEVHDPGQYLTPDVTLDLTDVQIKEKGPDEVAVWGARGSSRPDTLKVCLGVRQGFVGDASMMYAGSDALTRATMASDIIRERWTTLLGRHEAVEVFFEGATAARPWAPLPKDPGHEIRVRFRTRTLDRAVAVLLGQEVEALYTNGPAGGGGASRDLSETVGVYSCLIPRDLVTASWTMVAG